MDLSNAPSEVERAENKERTDAIIAALKRKIGSDYSIERTLRAGDIPTEKLLAMALNALVHHSKGTLMLMEGVKLLAQRAVEEKKANEATKENGHD